MVIDTFRTRLWLAVFALAPAACPRPPANVTPTDAGVVAVANASSIDAGVVVVPATATRIDAPVPVTVRERVDGASCVSRATADANLRAPDVGPGRPDRPLPKPVLRADNGCPLNVQPSITSDPSAYSGYLRRDLTTRRRATGADDCCYGASRTVPGRAYVDDGVIVAAHVTATHEQAQRWLDDAALEHASVASFARATLELMAVGAPLALVRDMQQAALDEVKHAELCLEIAQSLGARDVAFGPLPALSPRNLDRTGLARACLEEACVNETIAAARAHDEATRSRGRVAEVLRIIANDEERHAALAWRTLRWLVDTGGMSVVAALRDVDVNDELSREILAEILAEILVDT